MLNTVHLLEIVLQHDPEKISWRELCFNPNAIHLLEKYPDKINWKYGLLLAVGSALGGWVASRWSVNKGDNLVKKFMIVMVIIMAIKLWFF